MVELIPTHDRRRVRSFQEYHLVQFFVDISPFWSRIIVGDSIQPTTLRALAQSREFADVACL